MDLEPHMRGRGPLGYRAGLLQQEHGAKSHPTEHHAVKRYIRMGSPAGRATVKDRDVTKQGRHGERGYALRTYGERATRLLALKARRGLAYNPESPFQRIVREGFGRAVAPSDASGGAFFFLVQLERRRAGNANCVIGSDHM